MSKEVKRYELRIVDRYAGDGTGDIETDARMKQEAKGRYVLFSDYDALLTERDALEGRCEAAKTLALKFFELAAQLDPVGAKAFADQLDLQGEQP